MSTAASFLYIPVSIFIPCPPHPSSVLMSGNSIFFSVSPTILFLSRFESQLTSIIGCDSVWDCICVCMCVCVSEHVCTRVCFLCAIFSPSQSGPLCAVFSRSLSHAPSRFSFPVATADSCWKRVSGRVVFQNLWGSLSIKNLHSNSLVHSFINEDAKVHLVLSPPL